MCGLIVYWDGALNQSLCLRVSIGSRSAYRVQRRHSAGAMLPSVRRAVIRGVICIG